VLNALLALFAFWMVVRWKGSPRASALPGERFIGAMRVGLNYAVQAPRLKLVLLRVFLFFLQSTALLALLPLVAQGLHGGGAGFFTVMLSCLGLGAVIVGVWWVTGRLGHLAEHPATLEEVWLATNTQRMESLTFTAPMAYTLDWIILFSDTSKVLTTGVVTVAGVVAGSFVQAMASKSFHWEGFRSTQDTALHIGGALLMGVGGVTALGCTVGQGLSGLSTLSLTSMIAVAGIVLGAIGGFRFQMWLLEHE
jgi:hypothetical protein